MNQKKEEQNFKFFCNRECEFFPCHKVKDENQFNCMFCYCPLYALGDACGGNFKYTEAGIKDCSDCMIPHSPGGYDHINEKFPKLAELAKKEPMK